MYEFVFFKRFWNHVIGITIQSSKNYIHEHYDFYKFFTSDKFSLFQSSFQTVSNQTGNHTRSRKKSKFIAFLFTTFGFHQYKFRTKKKPVRRFRISFLIYLRLFGINKYCKFVLLDFWLLLDYAKKFINNPCFKNHFTIHFYTKYLIFLFICFSVVFCLVIFIFVCFCWSYSHYGHWKSEHTKKTQPHFIVSGIVMISLQNRPLIVCSAQYSNSQSKLLLNLFSKIDEIVYKLQQQK